MRLIDADALYKRIPAYVCVPCAFIEKDCKDCVVQRVMNIVDNFPTIEAVDVVHGEWINLNTLEDCGECAFMCSICGEIYWSDDSNLVSPKDAKYCPNCGAKMDGKEQEDE